MPFKIIYTTATGAKTADCATAQEAFDKKMKLESSGYQRVTVKDDAGRVLTVDQLVYLTTLKE